MRLDLMSYAQVRRYLEKRNALIIPIGSVEQHSPDGLLGTDYLIARRLAEELGEMDGIISMPAVSFGIAPHHLAFAGTVSLRPTTLIRQLQDILQSMVRHGFRQFFFVNGHGGNIPAVLSAFSEISLLCRIKTDIQSWWRLPEVRRLEQELFGEKNGVHATISEISVTRYLYPEAFPTGPEEKADYSDKNHETTWPLSPEAFREYYPTGAMGSDPTLADAEKGKQIFECALRQLRRALGDFLKKAY